MAGNKAFEQRLTDRFGELPLPALELFNLVRLRRVAEKMGVERIILKKSLMVIHFTSNIDSGFYSSDLFVSILNYVNRRYSKIKVKQTEKRLSLTFRDIDTIEDSARIFREIQEFHTKS